MRDERGFALVAVLWLVVAISAAGLQLSLSARERRLVAVNTAESVRAKAAARAAMEHARARLEKLGRGLSIPNLRRSPEMEQDPWHRPGLIIPDTISAGYVSYHVSLRDAGARLHLNRASEEELKRLFRALRVDFGRADRIAQAIMDWRDPDDDHRARGAEREEYVDAPTPVLPRNGPFQTIDELRYVRGMDEELLARIRPQLTLLGTGRVNLNSAPPEVLLALEGMTEQAVTVIERLRRQGRPIRSLSALRRELAAPAQRAIDQHLSRLLSRIVFDTREVIAEADGWIEGGSARARMEGLFVRSGTSVFLVWQRMT